MPDSEMSPPPPSLPLCIRKWQPATSPSGEGEVICAAHQELLFAFFKGATQRRQIRFARCVKKNDNKKKNQALNSLLYLSARCPSGGRRHASLSLPHAFIPISGCLWQGKLSAGVDFVFLQKKKNKQDKQKTSFCYGPSGLNATPRGKLRKNGNSWTTFWSNCSPCRPLQTLSAAILSLSFL